MASFDGTHLSEIPLIRLPVHTKSKADINLVHCYQWTIFQSVFTFSKELIDIPMLKICFDLGLLVSILLILNKLITFA